MKIKFFNLAKKLSLQSDHKMYKLGSVVVKKNRVLGIGFNKLKTHVRSNHPYKHTHAELSAILNVKTASLLDSADIYIFRQNKFKQPSNSYPCKYCLKLLKDNKVKTIYYTNNNSYCMQRIK